MLAILCNDSSVLSIVTFLCTFSSEFNMSQFIILRISLLVPILCQPRLVARITLFFITLFVYKSNLFKSKAHMQTNKLLQFKAQMDADMLIILPILSPFFIFLSLPFSFAYLLLDYFNSQASFPNLHLLKDHQAYIILKMFPRNKHISLLWLKVKSFYC